MLPLEDDVSQGLEVDVGSSAGHVSLQTWHSGLSIPVFFFLRSGCADAFISRETNRWLSTLYIEILLE